VTRSEAEILENDNCNWTTVTVAPATLSASLTVTPPSGPAPFGPSIEALEQSNVSGTRNFSFWWDCSNPTTSISAAGAACGALPAPALGRCEVNDVGAKCDGINDSRQAVIGRYPSAGAFTAKVIVEKGLAPNAEARRQVQVDPSPLTASCSVNPTNAALNQQVTWSASASGGTAPLRYSWSGTNNLSCAGQPSAACQSFQRSYTSSGAKSASVTVLSADGQTVGPIACTNQVVVAPQPTGDIQVKRVDASRDPISGTTAEVDSLAAQSVNPATFANLLPGNHTVRVTDAPGLVETAGACTYARSAAECGVSDFSSAGVNCNGIQCALDNVIVTPDQVTKVVFRYTPQNQAPVAAADISLDGTTFSSTITVPRNQPVNLWAVSNRSSDPDGWDHPANGVSSGTGRCEWSTDLSRDDPMPMSEEQLFQRPANPTECAGPSGVIQLDSNRDLSGIQSFVFSEPAGTIITYQILRIVDHGDRDSFASVSVRVEEPTPTPADLTASITNPGLINPDNTVIFRGVVANVGGTVAPPTNQPNFTNRFQIDVAPIGSGSLTTLSPNPRITSLAPNASQEVVSGAWTAVGGTHRLRLCADSTSVVPEGPNEGNNCATFDFTVENPPSVTLGANPGDIFRGEISRLSWSNSFVETCNIEPSQEIGTIDPGEVNSGFRDVSPFDTTTYTMTCTGRGGTDSAPARVTVTPLPACRDGIDNDGDDPFVDFNPPPGKQPDPGCSSPDDNNEADPPIFCEINPDDPDPVCQ